MQIMRFCQLLLAVAVTPLAGFGAAAQAQQGTDDGAGEPLAVVLRWSGAPRLLRAGVPDSLAVGARLLDGDRLEIPDDASVTLLHRSGRVETARAHTTITDSSRPPAAGLFARTARTLGAVASLDARSIVNREGFIRPLPGTAVPLAPARDVRVLERRPVFTWYAVPGAASYLLQLRAEGGSPIRFTVAADTTWQPHEELLPGTRYEWTVAALPSGRPGPLQHFRVAGAPERETLRAALAELAGIGLDPEQDGALLAALIHREQGFLYTADALLQRLEDEGASGRDFRRLRADVRAALGDAKGAARYLRSSTTGS